MTDPVPKPPRHPAVLPLITGIAALVVGTVIAALFGMTLHDLAGSDAVATERGPILGVLLGAAIGVGGPIFALLWYSARTLGPGRAPRWTLAIGLGLVSGTVALLLAPWLEKLATGLPGFLGTTQGNNILSSIIEEAAKLLLPVLLLLFVGVFRDPIVGFWTAVVSAAWFGVLEGIGYVGVAAIDVIKNAHVDADTPLVMGLDVVLRAWADMQHPLTTGGAAIVIWLAAARLPAGRAWLVGIGAFLVASVLHVLNDGVLGYYITNGVYAGLAILALGIAIFFVWYRPQLHRLAGASVTPESKL